MWRGVGTLLVIALYVTYKPIIGATPKEARQSSLT
jgi:hypothetical protein